MLYTNLKHIETVDEFHQIIGRFDNVLVCCGRMDPLCVRAYNTIEKLEGAYPHVAFFDMEYDNPQSNVVCKQMENPSREALPLFVFYKKGELVNVHSGDDTDITLKTLLDMEFGVYGKVLGC